MENKKLFVTMLAVVFCLSLAALNLCAETWTSIQTPPPLDEHQFGVTYGGSSWVIVGDSVGGGGLVKTSPDGVNWTIQDPGVPQSLNCVTYGNGQYVAVGHFGTIITSPDGVTWTRRYPDPETMENFQCVGYGNNMYVAVGDTGILYTSSDGIHWAAKDSKVTKRLNGVCYSASHGLWVAVGYEGAIVTSSAGNSWKDHSLSLPYYLFHVVYGADDNLFVATSRNGMFFISDNGTSWSKRNPGVTNEHLYAITYGNSMYMAVGNFGAMVYSLDGRTWALEVTTPLTTEPLWGIGYDAGANRFVAVGQNIILYSTPDA